MPPTGGLVYSGFSKPTYRNREETVNERPAISAGLFVPSIGQCAVWVALYTRRGHLSR
jgi:hypothetical protein